MSANGRLTAAELAPIPGGQLSNAAAGWWNAGPARAGLRPAGPRSSYRTYALQVFFWNLWISGRGNLAARPGTSNHGLGNAIDLLTLAMRTWIDTHGARFRWGKIEAFGEWWHVNFLGGPGPVPTPAPKPNALAGLTGTEAHHARSLAYRRQRYRAEEATGKGPKYRRWFALAQREHDWIKAHMKALQKDARAETDGWKRDNRGGRYQILLRVLQGKIG